MRYVTHSAEPLEARIAPAILTGAGNAVLFFDADGDLVTVKTSKGVFQDPAAPGQTQFTFGPTSTGIGERLIMLDVSGSPAFDGASLSITAAPFDYDDDGVPNGDGLVDVGYIRARDFEADRGVDLGSVLVRGDLGAIDAGDNLTDPALGSLNVLSLGGEGLATGAPDLFSDFLGSVGSIRVAGNVFGSIGIFGGTQGGQVIAKLGSITIGGSLYGGDGENFGAIYAAGTIGTVSIGGGIFGGAGAFSGLVQAGASITSVAVGGAIIGGDGEGSGGIFAATSLGKLTVEGSVIGGSGENSARVMAQKIGPVTIGGSLLGGDAVDETLTGTDSGLIFAFSPSGATRIVGAGTIGPVTIGGSMFGGTGDGSGAIAGTVGISRVTIAGSVEGGEGNFSGVISAPTTGPVKIVGSLSGGGGDNSGAIHADKLLKGVTIGGPVFGSVGNESGVIRAGGQAGPIKIGGSLFGGEGEFAGSILSQTDANFSSISIGGHLQGGSGPGSGDIFTGGSARSVLIGGSIFGGAANSSGMIRIDGVLTSLRIGANLIGGDTFDQPLEDSGYVLAGRIGSATVGGTIYAGEVGDPAGSLVNSGAIRSTFDIGTLTVRGDLAGSSTNPVIISAAGLPNPGVTDVAIKNLRVNGGVFNAKILAGYTPDAALSYLGLPVNADAQIGSVTIGGDWIASDLVAGIDPGADGYFGDSTDAKIDGVRDRPGTFSRISSIIIGGRAFGTSEAASEFRSGIGAEHIGSLKLGGTSIIPLLIGKKNDTFASGNAYALGTTRGNAAAVPDGFDLHVYEV